MHLRFQLEAEKRNLPSVWKAMEIRLEPHLLQGKGREVGEEGVKREGLEASFELQTVHSPAVFLPFSVEEPLPGRWPENAPSRAAKRLL